MRIKAQGLLNAGDWIAQQHGDEALARIVRSCSPEVKERYASAIAIMWHPAEELEEFLQVAARQLQTEPGAVAEEVGAAGAIANLKGTLVRIAFYVQRPDHLLQRIAGLWSQFNDEGEMLLRAMSERDCVLEVRGVRRPLPLFCATITGWAREICRALGMIEPTARHPECRTRGQRRCVWEIQSVGAKVKLPTYRHPDYQPR